MSGVPQPPKGNVMDAPKQGWWKAKDGSWHPHRLVEVTCPTCGLQGGAPANLDVTSCPNCGTSFPVTVELPPTSAIEPRATPDATDALDAEPASPAAPTATSARPDPPAPPPPPPLIPLTTNRGSRRPPTTVARTTSASVTAIGASPAPPDTHSSSSSSSRRAWAGTIAVVMIALVTVVIGAIKGSADPVPVVAQMHFCTSGSAPTVNIKMSIGTNDATSLANVPNGHCAVDQRFVSGSTLKVEVLNTTGVGEVVCTIVRNGRRVDIARSTLRSKPATCDGRA